MRRTRFVRFKYARYLKLCGCKQEINGHLHVQSAGWVDGERYQTALRA